MQDVEQLDLKIEISEVQKKPSIRSRRGFQMTKRDFEILRFLLDMKFADLIQIHLKFFSNLFSGEKSRSTSWASGRLKVLSRMGLLAAKPGLGGRELHYIVTTKGRMLLQSHDVSETHLMPTRGIDIRTFEHDRHVVNARLALERLGRAKEWNSERRMKAELSPSFNLRDQFLPDGIYKNVEGKSIAFELEIAVKERRRYVEKVEKYMDAFRRTAQTENPLRGVLFVATSELVFKKLSLAVEKYPNYFQVERYSELVTSAQASLISNTELKEI